MTDLQQRRQIGVPGRKDDKRKRQRGTSLRPRRLRMEALEDRRLLALGDLLHTLVDPGTTPQASSLFGHGVAVDGNLAVVGAPYADVDGFADTGRAYVMNVSTGELVATLNNPTPADADGFGWSVAISGSAVVVAAGGDDTGATNAGAAYVFDATTGNLLRTLNNPTPAESDYFGDSVAISESTVVVGHKYDDTGASDAGAAYIFDATSGALLRTLANPTPAVGDWFGFSVAVAGSTVVVGAVFDDTGASDAGAAYIFDATSGTLLRTLANPTPAVLDTFGEGVAVWGSTVVVGASRDNGGAADAGAAYVFDAGTGSLRRTLANPAPGVSDLFGQSVAISGSTIVVGALYDDTGATDAGAAYVFDAATGGLLHTLNNPAPADTDVFGCAVAVSGSTVLVGSYADDAGATDTGTAYVFDATSGSLLRTLTNPTRAAGDYFGSVAVSGNTVVVGARGDDTGAEDGGVAYVFDAATGDLLRMLNNPTPAAGDSFGAFVAVSGSTVVVTARLDDTGAADAGAAYVFDAATGNLRRTLNNPAPAAGDSFGASVAVSGSTVVVGAYTDDAGASDAGAAYVFDAVTGNLLRTLNNPTPAVGDLFGCSVAVWGSTVVVAARGDDTLAEDAGVAYIFDAATGNLLRALNNPAPAAGDLFGSAVAVSGSTVVVGANRDDTGAPDAGAAYVFDAATGSLLRTLNHPAPAAGTLFGHSVAVSGSTIVVGAFSEDTGATNAGAAYVFDGTTGNLLRTLNNPAPAVGDFFCDSAVSGSTIVVGAWGDNAGATDRGAAYVFEGDATPPTVTGTEPSFATSAALVAGTTSLSINFSEPVVGAELVGSYELRSLGPDALLGTADDTVVTLSPSYAGTTATLSFEALSESVYRITVHDAITDAAGNALDGDVDGSTGGDWVREFVVLPSQGDLFSATATYTSVGSYPYSVAIGDLNDDGHPDLAVANNDSSGDVGLLLGQAGGTFHTAGTYNSGGSGSLSVAIGDLNNDGHPDLAVSNGDSGNVGVLLGQGGGTFAAVTTYNSGGEPYSVAIGDLNGDGRPDLAVGNYGSSGNVGVLLGQGGGTFAAAATYSSGGTYPWSVAIGDLNGDGRADLAVTNQGSGNVGVLLGQGGGTFAAAATYNSGGSFPLSVAIGDVNGDGRADLAVANGGSGNVGVLLGHAGGTFAAAETYSSGDSYPYSVAIGDLNGDGRLDLALANNDVANNDGTGDVGVLLGQGDGTFAAAVTYSSGGKGLVSVAIGDLNGDGRADLAVANAIGGNVGVLPNSQALALFSPHGFLFDVQAGGPMAGQLVNGGNNAFDGLNRLQVGAVDYSPAPQHLDLQDGMRTLVVPPQTIAGLNVHREITVPNTGNEDFARTVDVFANTTDTPITTTVRIVGNLGSDAATTLFGTWDGDTDIEVTDQWIGTDDGDGTGAPAIVHYIHGPAGLQPTAISISGDRGDNIEWTYEITVPAGETVRLAHFTILANSRSEALAAADALVRHTAFGGQAAAFLSPEELNSIVNFQFLPNTPPVLAAIGDKEVDELTLLSFTVSATDPDLPPDPLTYTATGLPPGALFDPNTRQFRWTPDATQGPGSYQVTFSVSDGIATDSETITITVYDDPGTLIVTRLVPTGTGFAARFNRALEPSVLNLYDSVSQTLGPADVTVTGATHGPAIGSLVVSADQRWLTFIQTGGLLEPDTYTVTLFSGATRFREPSGGTLDGNADGTPGDNYQTAFTVSARPAGTVTISLPDLARGAGQPVNIPNAGTGLPIRLGNAAGVTSLAADLRYDPALLNITAATLAAGIPAGWSATLDTGTPGVARVTASGTTPLAGPDVDVVRLTAAVPSSAPYGAVQALRLENVSLNSGAIAAIGDVAVHKAAYLGDADGSGIHSSADAFLTVQAALGLASGFAAHAWTDPLIVGDADGSGVLSAADAFLIVQEGVGLSEPFLPDNPHITITPVGGGVDPQFRIDVNLPVNLGGLVSVPVNLAIEPAATNVGAIEFELFFDPSQLTIQLPGGVSAGADTAGWVVSAILVAPGQLRVGMVSSAGRPLAVGLRELARLQFHVAASLRDAVPLAERAACGAANPVSERPGYVAALDIEPVDPHAGGYAWTAVDGSVAIAPASVRHNVTSRLDASEAQDWIFRDPELELSPLDELLGDFAEDVAAAGDSSQPVAN